MTAQKWTEEEIAALKKVMESGASAKEAANRLGTGRSRNAIIGFIHRHGAKHGIALNAPSSPISRKGIRKRTKIKPPPKIFQFDPGSYQRQPKFIHPQFGRRNASKIKPPSYPPPPNAAKQDYDLHQLASARPIYELAHDECRFAVTPNDCEPQDHLFCGAPVVDAKSKEGIRRSYCRHHAERVKGIGTPSERAAHKSPPTAEGGEVPITIEGNLIRPWAWHTKPAIKAKQEGKRKWQA